MLLFKPRHSFFGDSDVQTGRPTTKERIGHVLHLLVDVHETTNASFKTIKHDLI